MAMRVPPETEREWSLEDAEWLFFVRLPIVAQNPLCWWWRAITVVGSQWESHDAYASLELCQTNAAKHGYGPVPA